METHRRSFLTERGIAVRQPDAGNGEPAAALHRRPHGVPAGNGYTELDLIAGAVHYWRLDRADWRACLTAVKQLGIDIVQAVVPWSVHERRAGKYDWSKDRDLAGFLDRVDRAGMYAVVCPGPIAGGELGGLGIPARVLGRADLHALTARGTTAWTPAAPRMVPVPSFAASGFRAEVTAWLAAVGEIVAPRLAPDGPVIGVHVGHEAQLVARLGPFEHDYHPEALGWWRELAGDEAPPRAWDPDDAGRCARWMRSREVYLERTLAWLAAALDDAGVRDIVRFHDLPWSEPGTFDLPGAQAALGAGGLVGMNAGHRAADAATARRRALYLAGSAAPLPFAPRVAVGGPALAVPAPGDASRDALLALLAAGVRGFGLSMAVERSRWYGAPVSEMGELQEPAGWLGRLLGTLADVEWSRLRRHAPVALVATRADLRFGAASCAAGALGPIAGALLPPGSLAGAALGRDADAVSQQRWVDAVERALCLAQIPYLIVDESCPVERLARFRAVILPTAARVSRDTWQRLHALAGRGTVVVIGPERPARDERDQPLGDAAALPPRVGLIRAGSAEDLDGLADDLGAVAGELPDVWITAEQTDVDCSLFVDPEGAPQVLFTGNRSPDPVIADVVVPAGTALFDALTDEELGAADDGIVDVPLGPHEVRMFLVD